ncbi:unnamed protein product, partial [Meganyctiphanes norvegica]
DNGVRSLVKSWCGAWSEDAHDSALMIGLWLLCLAVCWSGDSKKGALRIGLWLLCLVVLEFKHGTDGIGGVILLFLFQCILSSGMRFGIETITFKLPKLRLFLELIVERFGVVFPSMCTAMQVGRRRHRALWIVTHIGQFITAQWAYREDSKKYGRMDNVAWALAALLHASLTLLMRRRVNIIIWDIAPWIGLLAIDAVLVVGNRRGWRRGQRRLLPK